MTRATRRQALGASLLLAAGILPARGQGSGARIVSLGGAVTEILADLGAADRIVAVDTTSIYPPDILATRPNVGYLRQLSAEGILSVRPSMILAVEGAGPPDVLALVRAAGVPVVAVPEDPTEAGVLARIGAVAEAVGLAEAGRALADGVRARFATLAAERAQIAGSARGLFILSLQNGRALVGGRNTTADGMFRLAGIENAAAAIEGYKPMTDEAIVAARPDAVVMMAVGPGGAPPSDVLAGPALSQTPAGRDGRLVTMNGLYLLGFGPRTPEAARDLMTAVRVKRGG